MYFQRLILLVAMCSVVFASLLPPDNNNKPTNKLSRSVGNSSKNNDNNNNTGPVANHLTPADRFKQTFSFLRNTTESHRKFRIYSVTFPDGNYTGELSGATANSASPEGYAGYGGYSGRLRHGWGEMVWRNGTLFGPGNIFVYQQGDRYVGQWRNHLQHGIGTLISQLGVYIGDWDTGLQSGNGSAHYRNGDNYTGQFLHGFKHGLGILTLAPAAANSTGVGGQRYTGEFRTGLRHGQGVLQAIRGGHVLYAGAWADDAPHGQGVSYYEDGTLGVGSFSNVNNNNNNDSTPIFGSVRYAGEWTQGLPHGLGVWNLPNGMRYEGEFTRGSMGGSGGGGAGQGTLFNADGTVRFRRFNNVTYWTNSGISSYSSSSSSSPSLSNSAVLSSSPSTLPTTTIRPTVTTSRYPTTRSRIIETDSTNDKNLVQRIGGIFSSFWPFGE